MHNKKLPVIYYSASMLQLLFLAISLHAITIALGVTLDNVTNPGVASEDEALCHKLLERLAFRSTMSRTLVVHP